ncbi:MAG: ROK family protein, partial [Herbaspirillum sp.]
MSTHYIGALDIGGSKLAACVADASGPLLRLTEPTTLTGSESAVPEQALALLQRACAQLGIAPSKLQQLGVSSCGPFVRDAGGIGVVAPNLCGGAGAQQM